MNGGFALVLSLLYRSAPFAAPVDPTTVITSVFLERGVLGASVVALALFAWWTVRRERTQADAERTEKAKLVDRYITEIVPALVAGQAANQRLEGIVEENSRAMGDMVRVSTELMTMQRERRRGSG